MKKNMTQIIIDIENGADIHTIKEIECVDRYKTNDALDMGSYVSYIMLYKPGNTYHQFKFYSNRLSNATVYAGIVIKKEIITYKWVT
jgi:hypothetical protein